MDLSIEQHSNMFGYFFNANYVKESILLINIVSFWWKKKPIKAWNGIELDPEKIK